MAATLVGSVSHNEIAGVSGGGSAGTTISVTRNGIGAGRLIVVVVTVSDSETISNVSDGTLTDTTPDASVDWIAGVQRAAIYSFPNHPGGNKTFTATFNVAAEWRGIYVLEIDGADKIAPFDTSTSNTGSSAAASSGSITPALDGSYLVAFIMGSSALTETGVMADLVNDPTVLVVDLAGYAQAAKAAVNETWSLASGPWGALIAAYKPSVGTCPPSIGMNQRAA